MSEDLKEVGTQAWGILERHPGQTVTILKSVCSIRFKNQQRHGLGLVTSSLSVPEAWKTLGVTFLCAPVDPDGTILIGRAEINSSRTVSALGWGLHALSVKGRRASVSC